MKMSGILKYILGTPRTASDTLYITLKLASESSQAAMK
jgi:hypothetical protein